MNIVVRMASGEVDSFADTDPTEHDDPDSWVQGLVRHVYRVNEDDSLAVLKVIHESLYRAGRFTDLRETDRYELAFYPAKEWTSVRGS